MIKHPMTYLACLLLVTACANPAASGGQTAAVLAPDLGPSARAPARAVLAAANPGPRAAVQSDATLAHDAHDDVPAFGVVNKVDMAGRKLNISHEPIPAISWPSMTMDFPVAAGVNLSTVKPGTRVKFMMRKGAGDMYGVTSVRPAQER